MGGGDAEESLYIGPHPENNHSASHPDDGDEEGVRVQVDRRPNPTVGGDAEEIKISLHTRITTTAHSSARTATRHNGWWLVAADGKPPISYIFI